MLDIKLILKIEQSLFDGRLEGDQGEENQVLNIAFSCARGVQQTSYWVSVRRFYFETVYYNWCWLNYILAKRLESRDRGQLDNLLTLNTPIL